MIDLYIILVGDVNKLVKRLKQITYVYPGTYRSVDRFLENHLLDSSSSSPVKGSVMTYSTKTPHLRTPHVGGESRWSYMQIERGSKMAGPPSRSDRRNGPLSSRRNAPWALKGINVTVLEGVHSALRPSLLCDPFSSY